MHIDIVDRDVLAATRTAKNVVVSGLVRRGTGNVPDRDIRDADAGGRVSSWAAVEVVLLNVDTVGGDVFNADVFKQDVLDVSGGVLVGLDTGTVLGVEDNRVGEDYVVYVVV